MSHYYNVLNEGIVSGYFDKNICYAFLASEVDETIDILEELQSRHGGLMTKKIIPNYKQFKGMIEFYIQCYNIQGSAITQVPKYDTNKPTIE